MKKSIAILLVVMLLCSSFTTAMAAEIDSGAISQTESIAYMTLENADEQTKAAILAARNEIINNTSWVADGAYGYITDENGNVVEIVPQFSEIFPADWEIPDETDVRSIIDPDIAPAAWQQSFLGSVQMTPTMTEFHTLSTSRFNGLVVANISTVGYCTDGGTYSVEYYNLTTSSRWGRATNLEEGRAFNMVAPENARVSIRTCSADSRYTWSMMVHTDRVSAV